MNYAQAREIPGEGWHWTSMRDHETRTAWPCHRRKADAPALTFPLPPYDADEWERCEPHATKEEAERHFYDACLEEALAETHEIGWLGCQMPRCKAPTDKALGTHDLGHVFGLVPLCDEHRNRDGLIARHPFKPGIQLIHS